MRWTRLIALDQITLDQITLDQRTDNGGIAAADLAGDVGGDAGLVLELLERVAVRAVDDLTKSARRPL